jgi:hypothetical protein
MLSKIKTVPDIIIRPGGNIEESQIDVNINAIHSKRFI